MKCTYWLLLQETCVSVCLISSFSSTLIAQHWSRVSSVPLAYIFFLVSLCDSPWRTPHDPAHFNAPSSKTS